MSARPLLTCLCALLMLVSLWACHFTRLPALVHGGVTTPPASSQINKTVTDIIAQKAAAKAAGNNRLASALNGALGDANTAAEDTNLRWFMSIGIVVIAVGAGLCWFNATKLGGGLAVIGGTLIACALTLTALLPYLMYLALAVLVIAIGGVFWFLATHRKALQAQMSGTQTTDPHVQKLLDRVTNEAKTVEKTL